MGNARRRGTFLERKEQAVRDGRVKQHGTSRKVSLFPLPLLLEEFMKATAPNSEELRRTKQRKKLVADVQV